MFAKHSIVFRCALPPVLPDIIRSKVLRHFDRMVTMYLSNVMREHRMSDPSGQSGAPSSDNDRANLGRIHPLPEHPSSPEEVKMYAAIVFTC